MKTTAPKMPTYKNAVFAGSQEAAAMRRVSSESLLGATQEMIIVHNGREYRLRRTQNGKLILTA